MPINYESAWKQLKQYVFDMESYSKPYKGNGFKAVLLKMEELEKELTTEEPKDKSSTTISSILRKYNLLTDDTIALPDIKIGDYTLKRSGLPKLTKEDFEEAKKAWEQDRVIYDLTHDLEQELLDFGNKVLLEVDRWIFDTFKDVYGCTTPDEVFNMITSPLHIYQFKAVIEAINNKIRHLDIYGDTFTHPEPGKLQYNPLHGFQLKVPKEPYAATKELRNGIKQIWEEIYHE